MSQLITHTYQFGAPNCMSRATQFAFPQSEWTTLVDRINALKPPSSGPPDPVTKLWPRHLSKEVMAQQQGGGVQQSSTSSREGRRSLKERFPEYFACYGYD